LNYIYDEFFKGSSLKKRVPDNIINNLTPLALACWIMDDGSKCSSGIKLSTQDFLKEDIELLVNALLIKFNISSSIKKTGKLNQWIIYIPKREVNKVQVLIGNLIIKSMLYKIHK
jgi:ubiquinol-cytochrome c reductase cytochrome b subunit